MQVATATILRDMDLGAQARKANGWTPSENRHNPRTRRGAYTSAFAGQAGNAMSVS